MKCCVECKNADGKMEAIRSADISSFRETTSDGKPAVFVYMRNGYGTTLLISYQCFKIRIGEED